MEQLLNVHMMEQHFDAAFCFKPRVQAHILQTRHAASACTKTCMLIMFDSLPTKGRVTRAVGAASLAARTL